MFQRLRQPFEERDRLRLMVNYRRTFVDTLLREGEDEAERVREADEEAAHHPSALDRIYRILQDELKRSRVGRAIL